MSAFTCSTCGTLMETPAPGTSAACPGCGQRFEMPGSPESLARSRAEERSYEPAADRRGYAGPGPKSHSGLGIASFIIGLVVIVILLLMILLQVVVAANRASRSAAESMAVMTGIFVCGGLVASLAGLGLGVGGLFQENRNRTYAVVGVVLNGLVLLGATALILVGVALAGWR